MSVIDLNQARAVRERPDAEHVQQDQFGRSMYRFALAYEMDGTTWGADVWAYSFEDAERRVAAMRVSLSVADQIHAEIAGCRSRWIDGNAIGNTMPSVERKSRGERFTRPRAGNRYVRPSCSSSRYASGATVRAG